MAGPAEANGFAPVTVRNGDFSGRITPTDQELLDAAKRVLSNQHVVLWGEYFDLVNGDPDVAADWLARHTKAVLREAWWPKWSENL